VDRDFDVTLTDDAGIVHASFVKTVQVRWQPRAPDR